MGDLCVGAEIAVDCSASASLSFAQSVRWFGFWGRVCEGCGDGVSPSICC